MGLSRKPHAAKAFYGAIAAATFLGAPANIVSIDAVTALVWAAIINAIVAVPVMCVCVDVDGRGRQRFPADAFAVLAGLTDHTPERCSSNALRRSAMPGIHHVSIGVNDVARAKAFYDPLMRIVGLQLRQADEESVDYGNDGDSSSASRHRSTNGQQRRPTGYMLPSPHLIDTP